MSILTPEQTQNLTQEEPGLLDLIGENPGQIQVV